MPAYFIANIEVTDPARFEDYRQKVAPVFAQFGGRYLARGDGWKMLEGELGLHMLVLLEFPSLEQAEKFYDSPDYQPIKDIRLAGARTDLVLISGENR
jgi:uncharacterized protein (DUF1330 family)